MCKILRHSKKWHVLCYKLISICTASFAPVVGPLFKSNYHLVYRKVFLYRAYGGISITRVFLFANSAARSFIVFGISELAIESAMGEGG